MKQKTRRIIGWILIAIPLLFLAYATFLKFFSAEYATIWAKMFPLYPAPWVFGVISIIGIVLYLTPKLQVVGFAYVTAYYGGAAALAWQLNGFVGSLPCFIALVLLWIGQAMLRPSLLESAKE